MTILYDFDKPLPPTCIKCGYPICGTIWPKSYPMKMIDCPEHRPGWFKFYEDQKEERHV